MKKLLLICIMLLGSLNAMGAEDKLKESLNAEVKASKKSEVEEDDFYRYRLSTSFITRHGNDDDVYDNNSDLISLEYFLKKDVSVGVGTFNNSFSQRSYAVSVNKHFYPFENKKFSVTVGAGIVKGYERTMRKKNSEGEVVKTSEFRTNIFDDYMVGAAVSAEYMITDQLGIAAAYVGAYMGTVSFRF